MEESFRILIADPNRENREGLRDFLSSEIHATVLEASNSEEVLKIANETKIDLILMDSNLPNLNGYETAKKLKENPATRMIRILLLAPPEEKDKRLFAIESGADEMLIKPVDKQEILIRSESFLRVKYFYDQLLLEREKVQKMKEDFLAMITHDLKTPLTAIIGNTQVLMEGETSEQERLEFLRVIDLASRNLLILINNLLNVMRLDSGMITFHPENFLLERLCEEVLFMIQPMAKKKKIQVLFKPEKGIKVYADMDKIRQVISNLLSNAIKFTPESGTVTLFYNHDGEGIVRVGISDTGPGISKDDQARLFQKFSQKKGEKGGTGLGLYIVKKMLDLHETEIKVVSEPGKGTTFYFWLKEAT